MIQWSLPTRILIVATILAIPITAFGDPIGIPSGGGSNIQWEVTVDSYERIELRVVDPYGEIYGKAFKMGTNPSFRVADLAEALDGEYSYELLLVPSVSSDLAAKLKKLRAAGDDAGARRLMREAGLIPSVVQTGAFTILRGFIVSTDAKEDDAAGSSSASNNSTTRGGGVDTNARPGKVAVNDFVIADDLIVQGSTCTGLDCVNGEVFSFDTLRLKENNLRIHFDDTSTIAGFPANDWRIIANDSASGGASKFSVEDSTNAKTPLTIRAGAATNSIFVDSTGRVGFRTSTPVLDLHVATSNTPGIRLEQNNSGGFTAQTWDIAGNEANFFVRDVTGGSRLSFRIRPGAPTSSIDISADGDVGIGTGSPDQKLHAEESADENTIILSENTNSTGLSAAGVLQAKADTAITSLIAHGSGRTLVRFGQTIGGFSEVLNAAGDGLIVGTLGATPLILGTNGAARMTIDSTGDITVPGDFTVTGTKNFGVPDPADGKKAIYFSALEGPEAGTYYRGTAKTVDGEAVITLPGHFSRMTEPERMTVQLTPVGAPGQLYVASSTPETIVIRVADGSADLVFNYLVHGVRKGYLDFQVERENNLTK
jgi:hypothetical protein